MSGYGEDVHLSLSIPFRKFGLFILGSHKDTLFRRLFILIYLPALNLVSSSVWTYAQFNRLGCGIIFRVGFDVCHYLLAIKS